MIFIWAGITLTQIKIDSSFLMLTLVWLSYEKKTLSLKTFILRLCDSTL